MPDLDSILSVEGPDLGLFPILSIRNSAATCNRLKDSVAKDGLHCVACILFGSQRITSTTEPLIDWSNARRLISKHQRQVIIGLHSKEVLTFCMFVK